MADLLARWRGTQGQEPRRNTGPGAQEDYGAWGPGGIQGQEAKWQETRQREKEKIENKGTKDEEENRRHNSGDMADSGGSSAGAR